VCSRDGYVVMASILPLVRTLEVRRHSWTSRIALHHLEGARVTVDGDSFVHLELRRLASIRA
jgi:hypothetical protein